MKVPMPGSFQAWLMGCTCHPYLNRQGNGVPEQHNPDGSRLFAIDNDCPVHADPIHEPKPKGEPSGNL